MTNFLDTNLSVDNFISSLRDLPEKLSQLIIDWDTLDDELREEYLDQLKWMLSKAAEFIEQHSK
jgi:hypothetical protein